MYFPPLLVWNVVLIANRISSQATSLSPNSQILNASSNVRLLNAWGGLLGLVSFAFFTIFVCTFKGEESDANGHGVSDNGTRNWRCVQYDALIGESELMTAGSGNGSLVGGRAFNRICG